MSDNKNQLFFIIMVVFTVIVCVALVWGFNKLNFTTPQVPIDLAIITESKEAVPFFDMAFDTEKKWKGKEFLILDPILKVRNTPLWGIGLDGTRGPHDVLGFRNNAILNKVDIVTIGDSQTYGNNAEIQQNWPSVVKGNTSNSVYNISVGGWGPLQYLYFVKKASVFNPKSVVVALYTGNDAVDSLLLPYISEYWGKYKPNSFNSLSEFSLKYDSNLDELFLENFLKFEKFHFTPRKRLLANNRDNPAISYGYQIMIEAIKEMIEVEKRSEFQLFFTIIPSKEYVFNEYIIENGFKVNVAFHDLIGWEEKNIEILSSAVENNGGSYINSVECLRKAVRETPNGLYPANKDGHPLAGGYKVIGECVSNYLTRN